MDFNSMLTIALTSQISFVFQLASGNANECGVKCCAHYFREVDVCKECKIGTFRLSNDDDAVCKLCPHLNYGYRCSKTCMCSETERCDHEFGCVCINSALANCKDRNEESSFIWYIVSSAVVIVVMVVFTVVIYHARKRWLKRKLSERRVSTQDNTSDLYHEYQYIDENKIQDISSNRNRPTLPGNRETEFVEKKKETKGKQQILSASQSNDKYDTIGDGYLQPYYKTNSSDKRITNSKLTDKNDPIEDGYLQLYNPLSNDLDKKNNIDDGYLHPYNQLLKTSADVHEYGKLAPDKTSSNVSQITINTKAKKGQK